MKAKIKNWIIAILFATICGIGIAYFSGEPANARSTYVDGNSVTYDVVTVDGYKVAVFKYGSDIEVVKL